MRNLNPPTFKQFKTILINRQCNNHLDNLIEIKIIVYNLLNRFILQEMLFLKKQEEK